MKYYQAYDDRYRRVYAQGVDYWTANPDETASVKLLVDRFLREQVSSPATALMVEFGCGEGFLGEYLLEKHYHYIGLDISPTAIKKAQQRVPDKPTCFKIADITALEEIQDDCFDVALDNYCLHMLVLDDDRRRYLSEVLRVLKPGGCFWLHVIAQEEEFSREVDSFDGFCSEQGLDLDKLEEFEAFNAELKTTVKLPRLAARFNNCSGYRKELERVGFAVEQVKPHPNGIVVYARKSLCKEKFMQGKRMQGKRMQQRSTCASVGWKSPVWLLGAGFAVLILLGGSVYFIHTSGNDQRRKKNNVSAVKVITAEQRAETYARFRELKMTESLAEQFFDILRTEGKVSGAAFIHDHAGLSYCDSAEIVTGIFGTDGVVACDSLHPKK